MSGRVAERGTRGSVLVFAYIDPSTAEDSPSREPASVGTVAPDGGFDVAVPPSQSLTLMFLADSSNDGAVDEGDPIAVLTSPELTALQAGDRVQITDAKIDFTSHRVTATIEVTRSASPERTPTPVV